jgi:hypothetical protein
METASNGGIYYDINVARRVVEVYTDVAEALAKAAHPTTETFWVIADVGPAHEWLEATIRRDHPSSRINHHGRSGL